MLSHVGGGGQQVFWTSNLNFFIKENWICAMSRHHANYILLAGNLPFDSDVRKWSHPLLIPLHFCGLNRAVERVVNLNMTRLYFFAFVWFRLFICTVLLLFHSLFTFSSYTKKNWLTAKWALKKTFLRKPLVIFLDNCTYKNVKPWKSR